MNQTYSRSDSKVEVKGLKARYMAHINHRARKVGFEVGRRVQVAAGVSTAQNAY